MKPLHALLNTLFSFLVHAVCLFAHESTSFDLQTSNLSKFIFLDEAYMFNNTVRLTGAPSVPNCSAGRVLYSEPIVFRSPGNPNLASFETSFSFLIADLNENSRGAGLAFVITRSNKAVGKACGHLGVLPGDIALELDAFKDVEYHDINNNHVGLNIGSMISQQAVDLSSINVNLVSGLVINVWMNYLGKTETFDVFISYAKTKPKLPVLSIKVDISEYLGENGYVCLSGSNQGSTETHTILSWRFKSYYDTEEGSLKSPMPHTRKDQPFQYQPPQYQTPQYQPPQYQPKQSSASLLALSVSLEYQLQHGHTGICL